MDKELFEGAIVAGKEKIKKLRKKQYLCIFGIVYMVFCMILLPDSLMFAIGLVVIGFAGFKFWKFRKEYNLHKRLLEANKGVLRAINSSEEEEYDDPNVTYSAADLLGTSSSDDEDSAGEEDEEFEFDDEEFEEDDEEIIEYDLGLDDYFKEQEERARKYDEEYDGVKYSAADLLGSSSGETTKKTTKKSRSKKSGK